MGYQRDENVSKIFKDLRLSKNFSRDEAADGVMTASSLSRFESGDSMPGFDKVHCMLRNINVSLLEYDEIYSRTAQKQDILLYDMAIPTAFFNHDVKKLELFLSEIEDEIRRSGKFEKYRFNKWKIEAIIKQLDPSYDFSDKNIRLLSRYLMNLKKWGLYDIYLFGYCASIFDLKDLKKLTTQMLAYMQSTNHLYKIEHAVIQTALKVITSCLTRGEFSLTRDYINQLKHLKIHDYHMYDKFILTYLEASLDYQTGKTSALETLEKCQETALFCDCPATANFISREVAKLRSEKGEKSS